MTIYSSTTYSSPADIEAFVQNLGTRPMFVCDLDGNIMTGYSLAPGRQGPALGPADDPRRQSIPFGTSAREISALVRGGVLREEIFAGKAMDARLPEALVALVNRCLAEGEPYRFCFLTSRGADDALTLLSESGIAHPERTTLLADSGAALYIAGRKIDIETMTREEKEWIAALPEQAGDLQDGVRRILADQGFDPARCPALYVEPKGIASNIHYREILTAYGQPDNSPLDQAIGAYLRAEMADFARSGPAGQDGQPAFKILDGPATVEIKLSRISKARGMEALADLACAADPRPSAVVFSGDDVAKGNGFPGTDYFAMTCAPALEHKFGLPFYNIHVHHPLRAERTGTQADPMKSPGTLSAAFPAPRVDLTLPTPDALGRLIVKAFGGLPPGQEPGRDPGRYPDPGREPGKNIGRDQDKGPNGTFRMLF